MQLCLITSSCMIIQMESIKVHLPVCVGTSLCVCSCSSCMVDKMTLLVLLYSMVLWVAFVGGTVYYNCGFPNGLIRASVCTYVCTCVH